MRLRKIILFFLFMLSMISCAQSDPVFYDTQDQTIKTSNLRGRWIVVNYWAAWCHSCVEEIPELNRFYHSNDNKNIVFYGVNYDQLPGDALKEAIKKVDIQFPVLTEDPNIAWQLGDTDIIPVTFIIDPQGKVAKKIIGKNTAQSLSETLQLLQNNKNETQ